MVTVTLEHGGKRVTGQWLLDTGAAASVAVVLGMARVLPRSDLARPSSP